MVGTAALSVLLVEDDDVAAEAVIRGLYKHARDFPVISAEDGTVALRILRGDSGRRLERPYVVLLDLNMPRMSGFEFLQELRADPTLCDTPVFVLTTSGTEAERARLSQQNIAGYLLKSNVGPQCSALARVLTDYSSTALRN